MGSLQRYSFSGAEEFIEVDALLFDFDGTIIDSTAAIVKHWQRLGHEMGVDPDIILASSHGRRSIDVLKLYDPSRANWPYICELEGRIPKEFGSDAVELPGARRLLHHLDAQEVPWAIVTSGTGPLLTGWLDILKLNPPQARVVAEDVQNGKPDPSCYQLGRDRLGLDDRARILVIEDAPSGIKAGKAAGFKVVGLSTTHTIEQLTDAGADWIVRDLRSLSLATYEGGKVRLTICDFLVR